MEENLVIVESPAKAKTIEKFLGENFLVKSSYGHIRDLQKKDFGIDINNGDEPQYEVSSDKTKIVSELKKLTAEAKIIWLASDEDREGEAIAWHLSEVLKLNSENTKRIVFHEITKEAILKAIKNPRGINYDLVNAQQARRVLDRLVGFELSPVLWKKVKPSLSAGRVQSVAVRLIVEREREIMAFASESSYKVTAIFKVEDSGGKIVDLKAVLSNKFKTKKEATDFLEKCKNAKFVISDITTKPAKKTPSPPFTTSTLQQEASRKLNFSVSQTMAVAQKLYEAGKITYMRTDSVNLSDTALQGAKEQILAQFGEQYVKTRTYKSKIKGAQEAHEAIRPTYMNDSEISGNANEKRLYELIWKRTIASQMSDALLEKTTVKIDISTTTEQFMAIGEVIKFDGFLKVYIESTDDEQDNNEDTSGLLPPLKVKQILDLDHIKATQPFSHQPPRYAEASLVKKLEELGIGRPSTYAPTISTIQNRGYVIKESRKGEKRDYQILTLTNNKITEQKKSENTGAEKNKLFPTDIGMVVNDFLMEHFDNILNYNFTANVEKDFDEIAQGKLDWRKMIDDFYKPFHVKVENTVEKSERMSGERILGIDPKTKKQVSVRIGRYGPLVQLGKTDDTVKPQFASLLKGQHLETITLEEALELFKLPRKIGKYEDKEITIGVGRFGPYVLHDDKFTSLKKDVDDPLTIHLERAIELIEEKREAERNKYIKSFTEDADLQILNGRWGPYISYKKQNYKIPKTTDPASLTYDQCLELIEKGNNTPKKTIRKKA